jgi:hypothetical protein
VPNSGRGVEDDETAIGAAAVLFGISVLADAQFGARGLASADLADTDRAAPHKQLAQVAPKVPTVRKPRRRGHTPLFEKTSPSKRDLDRAREKKRDD